MLKTHVTLEQAQAGAYRILVEIEQLQLRLREVNNYIANYKEPEPAPTEEPKAE